MKRFKWREFFSDFRGNRMGSGDGEEQRYQAFKARFLEEQKREEEARRPEGPSPYDCSVRR